MAKHKEIETKWRVEGLTRKRFNKLLKQFLGKTKYEILRVKGDDVYYRNGDNNPMRHRYGGGVHELTVKGRLSMDSIRVRLEKNLPFAESVDPLDVHLALKLAGMLVDVQIYKDCDIYFIDDAGREVQVVWYKSTVDHENWRYFVEVEIPDLPQKKALKLLKRWSKIMRNLYGLTDDDVEDNSLYEIYSGRKYLLAKKS